MAAPALEFSLPGSTSNGNQSADESEFMGLDDSLLRLRDQWDVYNRKRLLEEDSFYGIAPTFRMMLYILMIVLTIIWAVTFIINAHAHDSYYQASNSGRFISSLYTPYWYFVAFSLVSFVLLISAFLLQVNKPLMDTVYAFLFTVGALLFVVPFLLLADATIHLANYRNCQAALNPAAPIDWCDACYFASPSRALEVCRYEPAGPDVKNPRELSPDGSFLFGYVILIALCVCLIVSYALVLFDFWTRWVKPKVPLAMSYAEQVGAIQTAAQQRLEGSSFLRGAVSAKSGIHSRPAPGAAMWKAFGGGRDLPGGHGMSGLASHHRRRPYMGTRVSAWVASRMLDFRQMMASVSSIPWSQWIPRQRHQGKPPGGGRGLARSEALARLPTESQYGAGSHPFMRAASLPGGGQSTIGDGISQGSSVGGGHVVGGNVLMRKNMSMRQRNKQGKKGRKAEARASARREAIQRMVEETNNNAARAQGMAAMRPEGGQGAFGSPYGRKLE